MSERYGTGGCPTGKVRHASEADASDALERVRAKRHERPDGRPPERAFYFCRSCEGWHLTSQAPKLGPEHVAKTDDETWEEYARRLERRIKEQRDALERINALRADAGNRSERKRIERLQIALGKMTARWEEERATKYALLEKLGLVSARAGAPGE